MVAECSRKLSGQIPKIDQTRLGDVGKTGHQNI